MLPPRVYIPIPTCPQEFLRCLCRQDPLSSSSDVLSTFLQTRAITDWEVSDRLKVDGCHTDDEHGHLSSPDVSLSSVVSPSGSQQRTSTSTSQPEITMLVSNLRDIIEERCDILDGGGISGGRLKATGGGGPHATRDPHLGYGCRDNGSPNSIDDEFHVDDSWVMASPASTSLTLTLTLSLSLSLSLSLALANALHTSHLTLHTNCIRPGMGTGTSSVPSPSPGRCGTSSQSPRLPSVSSECVSPLSHVSALTRRSTDIMGEPLVDANERETFGSEGRALIGSLKHLPAAAAADVEEEEGGADDLGMDPWRPNTDRNSSSPLAQTTHNASNGRPCSPSRY
jgi:hypothetical protein